MLTDEQLRILRHMLGIDDPYRRPVPYRDHYCANPGDPKLIELERLGMVEAFRSFLGETYTTYRTTEAGRKAAIESWHKVCRMPRDKRRYWAFLTVKDVCPDLTFHEFLTSPTWAESRANT